MYKVRHLALYLLFLGSCSSMFSDWDNGNWQVRCPALYPMVFTSYAPSGNLTGGDFTKHPNLPDLRHCVGACCSQPTCHVALMYNMTCYFVQCFSSKLCLPLYRPDLANSNPPSMVLVKPVEEDEAWTDFLNQGNDVSGSMMSDGTEQELSFFGANAGLSCSTSDDCAENEVCIKNSKKTRKNMRVCTRL